DPPAVCPVGGCQADHSCCAAQGTAWVVAVPAPINFGASAACFAGSACPAILPGLAGSGLQVLPTRFLAPGSSCSCDGDLCTGHCTAGACDPCRAPGTACANDNECCNPGCDGGLCGPCRGAGDFCTDGLQCCSGSCNSGPDGIGSCQ